MLEVKEYRNWSRVFHHIHSSKPLVIQIELTYKCPLRCLHCYAGCYNHPEFIKNQLPIKKVKQIIDKLHEGGCLWVCFSGGDPLIREDFTEIYRYTRERGFIVTVMTSLAQLPDEVLKAFKDLPPFSLETTLNGANPKTLDYISQVKGSFKKIISNIKKVKSSGLPLKIKTLLSKNNFHERDKLRSLVESLGYEFKPSYEICSRLNGDTVPLKYRLEPGDIAGISEQEPEERCQKGKAQNQRKNSKSNPLFRCGAGNWQWFISPSGRLRICSFLRTPSYNLLKGSLSEGRGILSGFVKKQKFNSDSSCKYCRLWPFCLSCPAKAKIEAGDAQAPVSYYCRLAEFSFKESNEQ